MTKRASYRAAGYCRLSVDDGAAGESGSIETQRTLLTQHCKEQGFPIHDFYCDDGWSGTSFERPRFQQMIADIEAGLVDLVVVKDLSRFGREYAQMGLYIEHFFVEHDVRFIAIGEGIDTLNGNDNILMPITNVINSLYAKDCSRKTKAAHRARAQAGKFLGSSAPFGYMKNPDNRHHLIIDLPAAEVVQHIFRMFCDGVGYVRMTKILREENILNPQAYFNQNNPDYYKNDYWRQPFDWHATSVRTILNNPVYLGKTVFGRTKTKGLYQKDRVQVDEEDWIIVEGTHEPIITQNAWDVAHKMMESRRRECSNGRIQMFAGLVKCSGCGSALNVSYDAKKEKFKNFSCWVYKNYGKERCTSHAIGWQAMQTIVLNDIRRNAQIAVDHAEEYLQMLTSAHTDKQKKETAKNKRALKVAEKRIAELDRIISKLYEDSILGKVSEARAQNMMTAYEQEQHELSAKRDALQFEISQAEEAYDNAENFIHLVAKYLYVEELNAAILNELIEKIVVHEKEIDWNGKKVQQVDIHYRFVGYLPVPNILEGFGRVEAGSLQELWEATEREMMAAQREFVKE